MRLIDKDALEDKMRVRRYMVGQDSDADCLVANAPTIDAIPVEWLVNEMNMADDRGDMEMTDAISWLIQEWQKEQEAR